MIYEEDAPLPPPDVDPLIMGLSDFCDIPEKETKKESFSMTQYGSLIS